MMGGVLNRSSWKGIISVPVSICIAQDGCDHSGGMKSKSHGNMARSLLSSVYSVNDFHKLFLGPSCMPTQRP